MSSALVDNVDSLIGLLGSDSGSGRWLLAIGAVGLATVAAAESDRFVEFRWRRLARDGRFA